MPIVYSTTARADFIRFVEHCLFIVTIGVLIGVMGIAYIPNQEGVKPVRHKTLYEIVMAPLEHEAVKHDKGWKYSEQRLDNLPHHEFLQLVSDALEERLKQEKAAK